MIKDKKFTEMEQVWKDEIAMRGPPKNKRIKMTIREEYKNAGRPIPADMLNAVNTEEFNNKKKND